VPWGRILAFALAIAQSRPLLQLHLLMGSDTAAVIYDPVNEDSAGWMHPRLQPQSSFSCKSLLPSLRIAAVSEPGILAKPEAVYLSLVCFCGSLFGRFGITNQVILLSAHGHAVQPHERHGPTPVRRSPRMMPKSSECEGAGPVGSVLS
jgi:hypothetical protein